jgi:hypothetical protein
VRYLLGESEALALRYLARADRAEAEIERLRTIEDAARELVRANDEALGAFRPRPDIAWRNLKAALRSA